MPNYPAYTYPNFQQQYNMPNQFPNNYFTPPMQQQLQQIQQTGLNGKIVESIDNVKLIDIPMDGNNFYFPKADGSEIYVKRWLANGSTEINVFKKSTDDLNEQKDQFNFGEMQGSIMEKLDVIDERIGKIEKNFSVKSSTKKEV